MYYFSLVMKEQDARFVHLKKDPRFKKVAKGKQKVKIDNRFKHMFTAPEFSSVDFLDKRGRKEKQVTKEKLERFYEVSSGEEEEEEEEVKKTKQKTKLPKKTEPDSPSSEEEEEDEKDEMSDSSDGESTDDEDTEAISASTALDAWDQVNTCTTTTPDSTHRLSICNLNWDRMNATDLFVLCNTSLKDTTGAVRMVQIFPSQFGKEQLAKEQEKGPDIKESANVEQEDEEEYSTEALRKYQVLVLMRFPVSRFLIL